MDLSHANGCTSIQVMVSNVLDRFCVHHASLSTKKQKRLGILENLEKLKSVVEFTRFRGKSG